MNQFNPYKLRKDWDTQKAVSYQCMQDCTVLGALLSLHYPVRQTSLSSSTKHCMVDCRGMSYTASAAGPRDSTLPHMLKERSLQTLKLDSDV